MAVQRSASAVARWDESCEKATWGGDGGERGEERDERVVEEVEAGGGGVECPWHTPG